MTDERLDVVPGNQLGMLGVVSVQAPREQAVEPDAEGRVDARDPPRAVVARDLDVARGDERRVADVDQAVVENVGAQ